VTRRRWLISLATAAVALSIAATSAGAASTRAEYVGQVDQVCRDTAPQFQAAYRHFKKVTHGLDVVRTETDAQEKRRFNRLLRGLGRYVARTARVFAGMTERMALVTPAPGDEVAVSQWIEGLRQFTTLQAQSAPAWKRHKLGRAAALSEESVEALNNGGGAVKDFGIVACLVHIDVPTVAFG
jgi:hypothetical protein